MDSRLLKNEKWVGLKKSQLSRENLEANRRELQAVCANCEDFGRVIEQKDGGCIKCEIFKALSSINEEIAGL